MWAVVNTALVIVENAREEQITNNPKQTTKQLTINYKRTKPETTIIDKQNYKIILVYINKVPVYIKIILVYFCTVLVYLCTVLEQP